MYKKIKIFVVILSCMMLLGCQDTSTTSTEDSSTTVTTITTTSSTSETTVTAIQELSDEDILSMILDTIQIPQETSQNILLEDDFTVNDYTASATWRSTASSVISSSGEIVNNVANRSAVLVLTLTYNEEIISKNFSIIVLGNPNYLVLYVVFNTLIVLPTEAVSENMILPTEYLVDDKVVTAVWSSLDESIISSTGVIFMESFEQSVDLQVELSYNSVTETETFTVTVAQDPMTLPVNQWHLSPTYTGIIDNEASKPYTPTCFQGAIYRKVVSNRDYWLGIEATITLPEFIPDPERVDASRFSYYLDNASIYMGGNAYYESDVGLGWSIGHISAASPIVSSSGVAFRPFWRYITNTEGCTNNNCYRNSNVNDYEFYYFPGDTIQMSVFSPTPGYMQLRIELLTETTNPDYAQKRADYGLTGDFNHLFVSDVFPSAGMGEMKAEFKRVNAIDQVSNEGKPTLNTNAQVNDAIWQEVYLYRRIDDLLYKVPFTENRSASMTCPLGSNVNGDFSDAFDISYEGVNKDLGGEVVTLNPNNGTGKLYNLVAYIQRREDIIKNG